jgi:hypothetical protein
MAELKPWPKDCVIVVAPLAGDQTAAALGCPVSCECKDCRASLVASSFSVARAESLPSRFGRPVLFLCPQCCVAYDAASIDELYDHAGVTGAVRI